MLCPFIVESLDSLKCQDHAGTNKMNLLFLSSGSCLSMCLFSLFNPCWFKCLLAWECASDHEIPGEQFFLQNIYWDLVVEKSENAYVDS